MNRAGRCRPGMRFGQGSPVAGRSVAVVVLTALLLGACGGSEEPGPVSTPERTEEPSPTVAPDPEPTPEPDSPPPPAPPPVPPPVPASPEPAPPPPAAPERRQVTGPAQPGEYLFDDSGFIETGGCLVATQPPPTPTRLVVGPQDGNRQQIERLQTGAGDVGASSRAVLEYREDGANLISLRQEQRVSIQTLVLDFRATTPQRILPAFPEAGDAGSYSLTSADGAVRIDGGITVEATEEQVALGNGQVVATVRVRTTSLVGGVSPQGSLNLNITRTTWYSPEHRLEIKELTETGGTVGLCQVTSRIESLARAL